MLKKFNYPADRKKILSQLSGRTSGFEQVMSVTENIVSDVKKNGDSALIRYTEKFDGPRLAPLELPVQKNEIGRALKSLSPSVKKALETAIKNIQAFHERDTASAFLYTGRHGETLGKMITPVENAGIYIPGGSGGKTPLLSTALMNIIPARIAGCRRIFVCTPPAQDKSINPALLAACSMAGADEIYRCGGAQAIAAMAYGTLIIKKADLIAGPGNRYVNCAKKIVFGDVMIDGLFGHSEIVIIADHYANPVYIASDLLSQAEHAGQETAVLISTDDDIIDRTLQELKKRIKDMPRRALIESSFRHCGLAVKVPSIETAFDLSNQIAPEHLEICVQDAAGLLGFVKNAGAVFAGAYSSEPIGDYIAGTNHILPTNGTARFSSPLGVKTFCKETNIIIYNQKAFNAYKKDAALLARLEGLHAHAGALAARK